MLEVLWRALFNMIAKQRDPALNSEIWIELSLMGY